MMNPEKWTDTVKQLYLGAKGLSKDRNHIVVDCPHILMTLLDDNESLLNKALTKCEGGDLTQLRSSLLTQLRTMPSQQPSPDPTPSHALLNILTQATKTQESIGDSFLAMDTLISTLLKDPQTKKLFCQCEFSPLKIEETLKSIRGNKKITSPNADELFDTLSKYSIDFTALAESGKIDPVIGRENEIRRVIRILSRRTKNNPILIGEPGVGKTAIIEGLAQRIINHDVPQNLQVKLISLDIGLLLSGTKYRGEFEERLKSILAEIQNSSTKIILFIDEIHLVMGAGKTEGSLDAANLLKPMLARGELRCIGATTLDEYQKHIEKDAAFERRFQQVIVKEPSVESSISILRGIADRYATYHGVKILDSALVEAVRLSHRYVTSRFLPDKAIDLLDEACANVRVQLNSQPEQLDVLDRKILQLQVEKKALEREIADTKSAEVSARLLVVDKEISRLQELKAPLQLQFEQEKGRLEEIRRLNKKLAEVKHKIELSERRGDVSTAADLKFDALPGIQNRLQQLQTQQGDYEKNSTTTPLLTEVITPEAIADVVSKWTGIPVSKLSQSEKKKLLSLEKNLNAKLIGQRDAIHAIARCVLKNRAGMSSGTSPIGTFLFLGPTGVGKTELCKLLAQELYDSTSQLVRVDMSEFMEKHSVSKLIGVGPGYVGYDEGGMLTEKVRRNPYSVILLDEIEKAHADVCNLLLQLLDEGRLTDGKGRTVDFKNTVIIMTSNIGAGYLLEAAQKISRERGDERREKGKEEGKGEEIWNQAKERVMSELNKFLRPELINRLDDIIVFRPLESSSLKKIIQLQLKEVEKRMSHLKISLRLTDAAVEKVEKEAFDYKFGVRPLKRYIEREIISPLSVLLLGNKIAENATIVCDVGDETRKIEQKIEREERDEMEDSEMEDELEDIQSGHRKFLFHVTNPERDEDIEMKEPQENQYFKKLKTQEVQ